MVRFGETLNEKKDSLSKVLTNDAFLDYDLLKEVVVGESPDGGFVQNDTFFAQWDLELLKVRDYTTDRLSGKDYCALPCGSLQFSAASRSPNTEVVGALVECVELNREGFRKIAKKYAKTHPSPFKIEDDRLHTFDMMMAQNMDALEQLVRTTSFDRKTRLIQCSVLVVLVCITAMALVVTKASPIQICFVFGLIAGFMTAWANAANDICNSVGTAVGGGALTMFQAVFLGALFEVIGCLTLGPFVSKSIVKGIIDTDDYQDTPNIYAYGMVCVLFGTSVTTLLATVYGYPISATHGIIGGLIAVGMAAKGSDSVGWNKVAVTACGWVAAPLAGGLVSIAVFALIHYSIYRSQNPAKRSMRLQPLFIWLTFTVNIAFVLIKGPKAWRVKPLWLAVLIAAAAGLALIPVFYAVMYVSGKMGRSQQEEQCAASTVGKPEVQVEESIEEGVEVGQAGKVNKNPSTSTGWSKVGRMTSKLSRHLGLDEGDRDDDVVAPVAFTFQRTISRKDLEQTAVAEEPAKTSSTPAATEQQRDSEKYFVPLLILSALSVACAHGGNDVGNAVGPLSAIIMVAESHTVASTPEIPFWALCYGSAGFVLGIVTMGRLTIKTVGTKLTTLTPSKSFATQMGGAVAVLGSSALGLPVSTSHCLVGSVVGIGVFEQVMKTGHLNLAMLSRIALAWGMTIPLAMIVSTICFVPFMGYFE